MTQREITFICTDSDISPRTLQYGGLQGEDNATELKFDVSDLDLTVESGHSVAYRMDCTDGTGGFYSENLTLQTGSSNKKYVLFSIPYIVTRPGGVAKLHLVISDLDSDNVEAAILYSKAAKLYFDATGEGSTARNRYKRELSGLMEESAASAAESAASAASAQESAEYVKLELEKLNAVNRITLNEPLSVDSTGKQLTVKITYYGGDDPSPITATQVLSSTYHDANCIRYINLSHDLDAGEVVNVTADRDPEGWTSIANITIANGMWQLSSVIWLDDILFHNADENAHPALKEHSDSAIAAHNTNSEAHADIRAEIEDMHAVNRIRLDAPLSVGVAGHYVRVLHRPPAGQGDETLRFSLNGAIPADAEKFVIWMKADQALASGIVQLKLRKTADASPAEGDETYFFAVGKMWDRLEIDLTALADKTVYRSMMLVINGAAGVNIYFDQISYIMEDGSTRMLYSFDDLTPTNYAPPQYAYGVDGCNFYGVQAIGCVNVGTIDQSGGWMWHGEIEVMDKEDPAPDTGKYLTVKASYYCGDNSSLVTAKKTFLSTDCDFGLQYINLSHDPDAEELASVTSTRDPAGWTSIAVIQILNDMWQLPSVIWLDDVLYHDQSETAHADIRKELEAVGDDIGAQIEAHNDSLSAHPYIKQNTGEQIRGHNLSPSAHEDIRDELEALKQQGIVVDAGSMAYSLNLKLVNGKPVIEYDEIQGGV